MEVGRKRKQNSCGLKQHKNKKHHSVDITKFTNATFAGMFIGFNSNLDLTQHENYQKLLEINNCGLA